MCTTGLKGMKVFNSILMCNINKTAQNTSTLLIFKELVQVNRVRKTYSTSRSLDSYESSNSEAKENDSAFTNKLIKWAIQNNISLFSFSKLLKTLSEHGVENLPNNSRTLLKAREEKFKTSAMPPGIYTHFGLESNIRNLLENLIMKNLFSKDEIGVSIFIDNLPMVKFTHSGLWVILGSIEGFTNNIFFIGAYHGYSKPKHVNIFLSEFVEEAKHLCTHGVIIFNKTYDVKIKRLICDAPAKAFVLNIKDFHGYSSCTKCNIVGDFKNKKMCFQEKSTPRTDEDFANDDMYMSQKTNLLEIPNFGVVSNVTLDYMHLVCVGVLQKLVSIWLRGKKHWNDEDEGSDIFKNFVSPSEFQTRPKSFNVFGRWSANDFRHFLLYVGPVVLKNSLKQDYYEHFLLLHVACRLLCTEATPENVKIGRKLLDNFVENYKNLYKSEQITHNLHGLYHLADECASHGTLDSFSAFPFEKFLIKLRNTMKKSRKKNFPQIILRESYDKIFTSALSKLPSQEYKMVKRIKNDESLKEYSSFERLSIKNFEIIPSLSGDKYVLLKNNKVIEVTNLLERKDKSGKTHFIVGKEFNSVCNFYPESFKSFRLGMFNVGNLSDAVNLWPIHMIDKKCMRVPVDGEKSIMIGLMDENF